MNMTGFKLFASNARYHKATGNRIVDTAEADALEAGQTTTVVNTISDLAPTAFRAPRHRLSINKSQRSPVRGISNV